jgi:hypothetical protein
MASAPTSPASIAAWRRSGPRSSWSEGTASERCNLFDDDCDGLVDDADPSVDPRDQFEFYADLDNDGYGDPDNITLACRASAGVGVSNRRDCDDSDPTVNVSIDWYFDEDGDGVGGGAVALESCYDQGVGYTTDENGIDCAPTDPAVSPLALDTCGDDSDQDCSGYERTCNTWLYTIDRTTSSLERIDADTGVGEVIGPLGVAFTRGDLAYDQGTRTMFMVAGGTELYTVDLVTGAATVVGDHGLTNVRALALDTSTGLLYVHDNALLGRLYTINPRTAVRRLVAFAVGRTEALVYDEGSDDLLMVTADAFYAIDRATGSVGLPVAGPAGTLSAGGATWDSNDGALWYIDSNLYKYERDDPTNRVRVLSGLGPHDGLAFVVDPPN